MARKANAPWFWGEKNGWYATVAGKRVNLKVKGEGSGAEAVKAWHRLMASDTPMPSTPKANAPPVTVKDVISAFLSVTAGRVKANTLRTYRELLVPFGDAFPTAADAINPVAVYAYADRKEWGASYKNGLFGSVATAFRWAVAEGIIPANPLANLKRPPKASRGAKALVGDEVHERLMAVASPELRPLLTLLRETGARPSELASLTADMVNLSASVVILQ